MITTSVCCVLCGVVYLNLSLTFIAVLNSVWPCNIILFDFNAFTFVIIDFIACIVNLVLKKTACNVCPLIHMLQ